MAAQKLERPGPCGGFGIGAKALFRVVHEGVAGARVSMELMGFAMPDQLIGKFPTVLRRGVFVIIAEVPLKRAVDSRGTLEG